MNQFWQIKNEAESDVAEMLFYGSIADESWWGDEITPKQFAGDLANLGGKDILVRINSPGGDVFAAHAIYNQLKSYAGSVTVKIDGLAASAATIVAMAGKVIMPNNSLMMIHNPLLGLCGYYNAEDLAKMVKDLAVIKDSIIAAYLNKCKIDEKKLAKLMNEETWIGAAEALEMGFADVIDENSIDIIQNKGCFVINSVQFDQKNLKNINGFTAKIKKEGENMSEKTKLDKIRDLLGVAKPGTVQPAVEDKNLVKTAVEAERERLTALDSLLDGSQAVADIVNMAKEKGKTASEVQFYIDTIKKYAPAENEARKALAQIINLVKDKQDSGVDEVCPSEEEKDDEAEEEKKAVDYMVKCMNKNLGGSKNGRVG